MLTNAKILFDQFNSSSGLPAVDSTKLQGFNAKIDTIIEEYLSKKSSSCSSYRRIKNLQSEVDEYFVNNQRPETSEFLRLMTDICTKLNENPIVDSVNGQFLHKPSQKYSSFTNYMPQHTSDIDETEEAQLVLQEQKLKQPFTFTYKTHQSRYSDIDESNPNALLASKVANYRSAANSSKKIDDKGFVGISPQTILAAMASSKLLPSVDNSPAIALVKSSSKQEAQRSTSLHVRANKEILKQNIEAAEKYIKDIEALLEDRKLLQANRKVIEIEELLGEEKESLGGAPPTSSVPELQAFWSKHADLIELVKSETEIIRYNLEVLKNEEGWLTEKEKGKIRISYQFPDANSMSLKMESELDVPLRNLLCIANEFEYFSEYVPFVKEGYLVKDVRKATKVGYALMDVPMLSKRECYFYGAGFNLLDDLGVIPLISKSIHSDEAFCKKIGVDIPERTKHVRLEYKHYMFNIAPLGPNRCHISIVLNVDYKIPLVPQSIQNWCARKFAMFLFEKIIKKATNIKGSNWEKAMEKNKSFYDWLDGQIQVFLKNVGIVDDSLSLEEARSRVAAYLAKKNREFTAGA